MSRLQCKEAEHPHHCRLQQHHQEPPVSRLPILHTDGSYFCGTTKGCGVVGLKLEPKLVGRWGLVCTERMLPNYQTTARIPGMTHQCWWISHRRRHTRLLRRSAVLLTFSTDECDNHGVSRSEPTQNKKPGQQIQEHSESVILIQWYCLIAAEWKGWWCFLKTSPSASF